MDNRATVVFAADHNFALPLGTALVSLIAHKAADTALEISILTDNLSEDDRKKLAGITAGHPDVSLEYIDIDSASLKDAPEKRHLKRMTYARLLAPELVDRPRFLYLDCDIIVNADLAGLFRTDLKGNIIAAAPDAVSDYAIKYFFRPLSRYFNAGVMLIDRDRWQAENITGRALEFIAANPEKIRYADQDALNHLLENGWLELDRSWNYQLDRHERPGAEDSKIFHFVGPRKPWHYVYRNGYKRFFLAALQASPWQGYRYPDRNLPNFFKKYLWEPAFVGCKEALKFLLPAAGIARLKNLFWKMMIKRDSR